MMAWGVPLVCSSVLLAGAAWLLTRAVLATAHRPFAPAMRWILPALAVVYVVGIWWAVPWSGWAPDEVPPDLFLAAVRRHFAGGWYDKYPPMQFYLNGLCYLPFLIAARLGPVDLSSAGVQIALLLVSRALSAMMALGSVCAIYILADDLYGEPGAPFAATMAGVMLPFVYYAKIANVDVPSIFWFAWSLVFYARVVRGGRTIDGVLFAVMAATSVESKDNTYGFYLLPVLHLLIVRRRAAFAAIAAGVAVFLVESGVLFNYRGFVEHVHALAVVGEDIGFQLDWSFAVRQLTVWRLTAVSIVWSLTWIGAIGGLAGIAWEIRRRRFLWLLLPVISYYLFCLSPIRAVFDRFVLGVSMIAAVFAGSAVDAVLRAGPGGRRFRLAACAAAVAVMAWYGASIDLMMIDDSRYPAERWLRARTSPASRVAILGPRAYLPRVPADHVFPGLPGPLASPADLPPFVVANELTMRRDSIRSVEREWWSRLSSGALPYRVAARFETRPAWSLLTWTDTFSNGVEDLFTNLDKVAPPIVIYERVK